MLKKRRWRRGVTNLWKEELALFVGKSDGKHRQGTKTIPGGESVTDRPTNSKVLLLLEKVCSTSVKLSTKSIIGNRKSGLNWCSQSGEKYLCFCLYLPGGDGKKEASIEASAPKIESRIGIRKLLGKVFVVGLPLTIVAEMTR